MRAEFDARHYDIEPLLMAHFEKFHHLVGAQRPLTHERKMLLGSVFSGDYALESTAIFNPSMVSHHDQTNAPDGGLRFIMSLRITGEGHISSIEFRAGTMEHDGEITIDPASRDMKRKLESIQWFAASNCGSPIETEAGWLVITHGVGPMRKYCISAALLDLHDPTIVIGRLAEPLLSPEGNEREGYVPIVVYSCGSLLHNGRLILPYAISDRASAIVRMELSDLLEALLKSC